MPGPVLSCSGCGERSSREPAGSRHRCSVATVACWTADEGVIAPQVFLPNVSGAQPSRQKEETCWVSVTTELLETLKGFILPPLDITIRNKPQHFLSILLFFLSKMNTDMVQSGVWVF